MFNLFKKKQKRFYSVGDVLPIEVYETMKNPKGLGGFISVDPETRKIKAIFIP